MVIVHFHHNDVHFGKVHVHPKKSTNVPSRGTQPVRPNHFPKVVEPGREPGLQTRLTYSIRGGWAR